MLNVMNGAGCCRAPAAFSLPDQFPWTPDFSIGKAGSSYIADYAPVSDKPGGTPVWVAITGNDTTGDGSESLPYRTISKAISIGSIIHIKSGFYEDDTAAFYVDVTADTAFIAVDGPGSVIWSANQDNIAWSLDSGDVYSAAIAMSVNDVADLTQTRSGETLIDGVTGLPKLYSVQTSIANVQANAGSFYYDSGTLYVHTHDSRAPDSDIKPLWAKPIWATSNITHTLYLQGIEFWGYNAMLINGSTSVGTSRVVALDCAFRFAPSGGNAQCVSVADVRFVNCVISDSYGDGFSYTNNSSTFTQQVLEWNCAATRCGRNPAGANNNNCSTAHNDCNVIRIGGAYDTAQGPIIADVSGVQSVCLGCRADNSQSSSGTSHVSHAGFSCGTYAADGTPSRMWALGCSAAGSGFDRGVSGGGSLICDDAFTGGAGLDSGFIHDASADLSPLFYDDLNCWFDFDDDAAIEITAGEVSQATDKSPARNDARQNDGAKRLPEPAIISGKYNGRKVTSPADRTYEGSLEMLASMTIGDLYIVASFKDGTDGLFDNYETLVSGPGTNGTPRIMGLQGLDSIAGNAVYYFSDGISVNGAAADVAILPLPFSILRMTPDSPLSDTYTFFRHAISGARGWPGDIAELLAFETARDAGEDTAIRAYLSDKWGI